MAKFRIKDFWAQFLFHTKIKTTYQNILPTIEILELRSNRGELPLQIAREKMLGEKLVIFALDSKLDLPTVTFVSTSASKFLWLVVQFDK